MGSPTECSIRCPSCGLGHDLAPAFCRSCNTLLRGLVDDPPRYVWCGVGFASILALTCPAGRPSETVLIRASCRNWRAEETATYGPAPRELDVSQFVKPALGLDGPIRLRLSYGASLHYTLECRRATNSALVAEVCDSMGPWVHGVAALGEDGAKFAYERMREAVAGRQQFQLGLRVSNDAAEERFDGAPRPARDIPGAVEEVLPHRFVKGWVWYTVGERPDGGWTQLAARTTPSAAPSQPSASAPPRMPAVARYAAVTGQSEAVVAHPPRATPASAGAQSEGKTASRTGAQPRATPPPIPTAALPRTAHSGDPATAGVATLIRRGRAVLPAAPSGAALRVPFEIGFFRPGKYHLALSPPWDDGGTLEGGSFMARREHAAGAPVVDIPAPGGREFVASLDAGRVAAGAFRSDSSGRGQAATVFVQVWSAQIDDDPIALTLPVATIWAEPED